MLKRSDSVSGNRSRLKSYGSLRIKKSDPARIIQFPWRDKYSEVKSAATDEVISRTGSAEGHFNVQITQFRHHQNGTLKHPEESNRQFLKRSRSSDASDAVERVVCPLKQTAVSHLPETGLLDWDGWPLDFFPKVGFGHLKLWRPISPKRHHRKQAKGGSSPFLPHLRIPNLHSHVTVWDGETNKKNRHKIRGGGDAQGQ